jgi:hypothetical protein
MSEQLPERPTCKTCPYWIANGKPSWGTCIYNPPTVLCDAEGNSWDERPTPKAEDSCGHHPDFPAWIASRKNPEIDRVTVICPSCLWEISIKIPTSSMD